MKTFVIAEIGSCHDGDFGRAVELVRVAKDAGADCVKAQFWSDGRRLAGRRNASDFADVYEKNRVPEDWLHRLAKKCEAVGLKFACTSYLPEDVIVVERYCDVLKIASFEAEDENLLKAHRGAHASGKRIIISLGMRGSKEPSKRNLVAGINRGGPVEYLHCVSAYPAPVEELELSCLWRGRVEYSPLAFDGFSDHTTTSPLVAAVAVAAGAKIVEKHVRLDDTPPSNPDYPHSASPDEFVGYVDAIRFAEAALFGVDEDAAFYKPSEDAMKKYRVTGVKR